MLFVAVAALAGCESNQAANLPCAFCNDDSQCGGNPCFQDTSGQQFCGAPCDSCPAGFSCQPLAGTDGKVVTTCFPDNESCLGTPGPNQSGVVDLGALAIEFLILGLDPYPRKPGAVFELSQDVKPEPGPFAALAGLKDKHGR